MCITSEIKKLFSLSYNFCHWWIIPLAIFDLKNLERKGQHVSRSRSWVSFPGSPCRVGGVRWVPLATLSNVVAKDLQDSTPKSWKQFEGVHTERDHLLTVSCTSSHKEGHCCGPWICWEESLSGSLQGFISFSSLSLRRAAWAFRSYYIKLIKYKWKTGRG
jgi:hypothetical protein